MEGKDYLYLQVKDYIQNMIADMAPHTKIPSRSFFCSELGVAKITVDRAISEIIGDGSLYVINGSGTFVAEKQESENQAAPSSSSASWGVIVPHIEDFSFPNFIKGVDTVASRNGINIIICDAEDNADKEKYYISKLIESSVQGVIIVPSTDEDHVDSEIYRDFTRHSIPCVFAIRKVNGHSVPIVSSNEFMGFYYVTKHLLEHSYYPIGFISQKYYSIVNQRLNGYASALSESGYEYDEKYVYIHPTFDERGAAMQGVDYLLSLPERPRAIACFNDFIASCVCDECTKRGFSIPGDIAVTGADNTHICNIMPVKLTSIDCSRYQIGMVAAEKLLGLTKTLSGDVTLPNSTSVSIIPQRLVTRESCGCSYENGDDNKLS